MPISEPHHLFLMFPILKLIMITVTEVIMILNSCLILLKE